jgi:hypothetical protein
MSSLLDNTAVNARFALLGAILALVVGGFAAASQISQIKSLNARPNIKLGVIDLAGIVAAKEQQFSALLTKPTVTDAERAQAFEQVKATGASIEQAVAQVRASCQCVLLTKGAVLSSDAELVVDYTGAVKQILGMS